MHHASSRTAARFRRPLCRSLPGPRAPLLRAHGRNARRLWWPSAFSSDGRVPRVAGTRLVSGAGVLLRSPSPSASPSASSSPLPSAREGATYLPRLSLLPCVSARARGFPSPSPSRFPSLAFPFALLNQSLLSPGQHLHCTAVARDARESYPPTGAHVVPLKNRDFRAQTDSSVVSTLRKWASSSPPAGEETEDNNSSSSSRSTTASG